MNKNKKHNERNTHPQHTLINRQCQISQKQKVVGWGVCNTDLVVFEHGTIDLVNRSFGAGAINKGHPR
jgi:hypothetical protein